MKKAVAVGSLNTCVLNELDRYHLAIDVIDRVPRLRDVSAQVREELRNALIRHRGYILEYEQDLSEIREWTWGAGSVPRAQGGELR